MAPPSATSSSTLSSSSHKHKRRRWTRDQLLRNLELIGELEAPLPPTLPPSPPASRAASPAAGTKRKLTVSSDPDSVKRPRTTSTTDRPPPYHFHSTHTHSSHQPHYQPQPTSQPPSLPARPQAPQPHIPSRSEPCEDGEVREEPPAPAPPPRGSSMDVPIRRPKKGKPSLRHFDMLHDKYHAAGRMLKYSGDARFWSTYPPGHREYRALPDPPPPTSPYHKHGGVIARLELLDALVCFTYSIWNRDYSRRACVRDTWKTIEAFLVWCKQKWQVEEGINDAEKAFLGLIWMIEAFIQGRQLVFSVRNNLDGAMDKVHDDTAKKIAAAVVGANEGDRPFAGGLLPNGKAPPMLPSPSSTNSTPVNRDDGTPSTASNRPAQAAPNGPPRQPPHVYTGSVPHKLLPENLRDIPGPIPQRVIEAMEAVTEPITPTLVQDLKDLTAGYAATAWCTQMAQQTLNLPLLRRCFPNTWARMMHSTLLPTEEHEPDFEDEEGELYWPDQCINGEGIGWVCLMGKAMINEFGKPYGYKGLEGIVPKPKPEESHGRPGHPPSHASSNQRPIPSGAPR